MNPHAVFDWSVSGPVFFAGIGWGAMLIAGSLAVVTIMAFAIRAMFDPTLGPDLLDDLRRPIDRQRERVRQERLRDLGPPPR